MNDTSASPRTPAGWHEAFAALPQEAPPSDLWPQLAARLQAPRPRRHVPAWALAAAVAALAAAPALWWLRPAPSTPPSAAMSAPMVAGTAGATPAEAGPLPVPAPADAPLLAAVAVPEPEPAATPAPAADTPAPRRADTTGADATLQRLYAESARLEALLAHLSDGFEPAEGVQVALSASLRGRLAGIDAALADAPLDERERAGLWHARVDALRQLTSLAADQRLHALYGTSAGGYALVEVY